jgi:hypothetical protein
MIQVAQGEAPGQIDEQARALGMRPADAPIYVPVETSTTESSIAMNQTADQAAGTAQKTPWWQPVVTLLAGRIDTQGP